MNFSGRLIIYALLWVSFGLSHSLLATPSGRTRLALLVGSGERLAYNAIAAVHLAIVLAIGSWLLAATPAFVVTLPLRVVMLGAAVSGGIILSVAGRSYDLGRFLGTTPWRQGITESALPTEPLATRGMNSVVRHPLYLGLILLMFGLSTTPFRLATSIAALIYILIGIYFEERKLLIVYGDAYERYRRRVPMLIPMRFPGRVP
ncbi:methyltransferase family protein [Acidiphilium sp.]|uniref:methyltransferase family protein n=1 Tax=Acidiphilium sp. TaxID=527 RepID=UPI003CFBC8C4